MSNKDSSLQGWLTPKTWSELLCAQSFSFALQEKKDGASAGPLLSKSSSRCIFSQREPIHLIPLALERTSYFSLCFSKLEQFISVYNKHLISMVCLVNDNGVIHLTEL